MTVDIHRPHRLELAIAIALTSGFAAANADAAMRGVKLDGMVFDSAPQMGQDAQFAAGVEAFKQFCRNNNREDLEQLYTNLEVAVAGKLAEAGMGAASDVFPNSGEIDEMLDAVEKECDREDDDDNFGLTTIIYSECRMTMDGMTGQLDIKVPAGADGHMLAWDGEEGVKVNLTQRVQEVSAQVGQGWSSGLRWQAGPGQTVERAGYPAASAQFEYSMGMGAGYGSALTASQQAAQGQTSTEQYLQDTEGAGLGQEQGLQVLSGMVSSKVSGWGYFSTVAPGVDIIQSFYRNFAENVSPSGDLSSFFGGMITSSVGLLEKGIPLEMHTTVESKVMGRTMVSGESQSLIYEVSLVDLPADWCTRSFIDESKLTDIDAQMQQALSGGAGSGGSGAGAAPGMTAEQAAQMNQGMEAMNQAMSQMTAEQKQALEGMGLGSMLQQMTGANPAGQAAAASAGSAASGRSGPSSADLTTGDMTQSVQKHLQALGYATGNTDGTLSTETVIAISQFQAEKGMKVTGEVSPQLLGILGAEVDSR